MRIINSIDIDEIYWMEDQGSKIGANYFVLVKLWTFLIDDYSECNGERNDESRKNCVRNQYVGG